MNKPILTLAIINAVLFSPLHAMQLVKGLCKQQPVVSRIFQRSITSRISQQIPTKSRFEPALGFDLQGCDPNIMQSSESIKKYVTQLCKLTRMERLRKCKAVHFGADEKVAGYSMIQRTKDSVISGHFANNSKGVYIDLSHCKYGRQTVEAMAKFTAEFFKAKTHRAHLVLPNSTDLPSYANIEKVYDAADAWGMAFTMDLQNCNPIILDEEIKKYVADLCELIKMKRFGECEIVHSVKNGTKFIIGTQLIETSLISIVINTQTQEVRHIVFSCSKYNPHDVAKFAQEFFKAESYTTHLALRK